jgi:uncharacterized protein
MPAAFLAENLCIRLFASYSIAVVLGAAVAFAVEVPPLTGRIVDVAHVLPSEMASTLSAELADHEWRTGNQIAVLTVVSLKGEPVESFSHRVATSWKLGRAGVDNGALLLIVIEERLIRLEVGYGLEGILTDATAALIIRREIVPHFRAGDYSGGIAAGLRAVMHLLERAAGVPSPLSAESPVNASGDARVHAIATWDRVVLAALVGAVVGGLIASQVLLRGGSVGGFIAFVMALSGGLLWAVMAAVLAVLGAVMLGVLVRLGGGRSRGRHADFGGTPWPSGDLGAGTGRDVFIGGGGDFGGGGASGRW